MNARLAALATLLLASCAGYSAPDSVVNGVAVITQHADGVNFASYTTYSVDPVVAVVDATGSVTQECSVNGAQLVPTIEANMDAAGYTKVAFGQAADLELKLHALLGSADYYYSGGYCGWYPYYYCYPGWSYAGSYSFGTLVLDMADVKNAILAGKLPLVWTAASYGVLATYYTGCSGGSSGNSVNWARLQGAIDRAFEQSPYIQK